MYNSRFSISSTAATGIIIYCMPWCVGNMHSLVLLSSFVYFYTMRSVAGLITSCWTIDSCEHSCLYSLLSLCVSNQWSKNL